MKTKAWVLVDYNKLELQDITLPPLEPYQVLVKILYTSICGSQLNEISGRKGPDKYFPHLLGHEAVCQVIEKHPNCGQLKICEKEIVIATWIDAGRYYYAPLVAPKINGVNAGPITTFSEYAIISTRRIFHLYSGCRTSPVEPEKALLGCTIPTGAGSFLNNVSVKDRQPLGVLGLGGVGLAAALWAKSERYRVIGYDTNPLRQEYAESLGIEKWQNWGGKYKYILECTGNIEAMENGFRSLDDTGILLLAGNAESGKNISIDPFDFIKGKSIKGIVGGGCDHNTIRYHFRYKTDIYKPLISKEYSLEQLDQAVYDMQAGQIIKPIIKCL